MSISERAVRHAADIAAIYLHLQLPEASAYHARTLEAYPDRYTAPVRQRLELGRYVLAEDYVRARLGAEVLRREVDAALDDVDALVLPTVPITAQPIGSTSLTVSGLALPVRALMLRLTQLFDITGHPAISLPCGSPPPACPPACSSSAAAAGRRSCSRWRRRSKRWWDRHSSLSTTVGSTRDARHAGSQQATAATSPIVRHHRHERRRVGRLHAEQQRGDQPVERRARRRARRPGPTAVTSRPCRITRPTTLPWSAPSAMRMPISRRRSVTM